MTTDERDDDEYWDALADRVTAAAVRGAHLNTVGWLGQSRFAWAATWLLAAAALAFVMRAQDRSGAGQNGDWAVAVAPIDEVGKAVALNRQPPQIGTLLIERQPRSRQ